MTTTTPPANAARLRLNPPPDWPVPPEGWTPAHGWRPDASWPPPPPGWDLYVADRPLDEPTFWGWRRSIPSAAQVAARLRDRHPSGWEILLVLAVFPGVAVLNALYVLAQRAAGQSLGDVYLPSIVDGHPAVNAGLLVPRELMGLVGAGLVAYLLSLSGGGLTAIGLDRSAPRADLARAGKLFLLAFVGPFLTGGLILEAFGASGTGIATSPSLVALLPLLLSAVVAGVVEETVVLGYLVHRLEQRGWSPRRVLLVCVVVRVSYHLYYGVRVLPIVFWAAVSVLLYRRRRRLLPFVVVHALWDSNGFVLQYLHGSAELLPFTAVVAVLLVLFAVGRRQAAV